MAKPVAGVLASFQHVDAAVEAIKGLQTRGFRDLTVYSASPNHEIEEALDQPVSWVRAFTLFGGRATGRTVELLPNQRIVQAWRVEAWPPGVYSLVRFELTANRPGTRIVLDHTGFPSEDRETLNGNWPRMYLHPLRRYLDM